MLAYRDQARVFKALAHPVRLRILYALQEGGQYVCHLVALLGCRQPTVSQHLAVLRAAGLVVHEREGNRILYCLNNGWLLRLLELLAGELGEARRASRREVCGGSVPVPAVAGDGSRRGQHVADEAKRKAVITNAACHILQPAGRHSYPDRQPGSAPPGWLATGSAPPDDGFRCRGAVGRSLRAPDPGSGGAGQWPRQLGIGGLLRRSLRPGAGDLHPRLP